MDRVEGKVANIETRLDAVEKSLGAATGGDLVEFQKKLLVSLRGIRGTLRAEEQARATTAAAPAASASNEALVEENAALKKEVAKLNYRIQHLLRHVPPPSTQQ
ncbi:unnamed protein product [Aphanomyces euteiches]|uniref:Uncharacterized protein n=1 Tax=Aphanomyces euteiches TaxID=100861 RepID=A0A6G0XBZ4_9STRA|nr:hypothetical protein Ae201684_006690 [Aphanomyces euteiches]KAH9091074.1 hypothetical protein Ae201684P_006475 [Aphanomyces euteiches]KAH9136799.1 hypothetical protein AeRB84_018206 [Aphanomyces euteiches]